jgi:branched-chain amino acid transport system substrate-binding protein
VALAVKQSGADILGTYITLEQDVAMFARQLRQLGVNIAWIGSPTTVLFNTLRLAGPALYNTFAVADFHRDSSPSAAAFAEKYETNYKVAPDLLSAWVYDAVRLLALSINNARTLEPEKIRSELSAINGHEGAIGTNRFDKNGDSLRGYNIVRNEKGRVVFDKHIEFRD